MKNIDFRQLVYLLIAVYFIYRYIGKPIIGLILAIKNALDVIRIKNDNRSIILCIPYQGKINRNIAEIISLVILIIVLVFLFKSFYGVILLVSFLSIIIEIITPKIYEKINGFYSEYIVINKRILFRNIHSWKKIESDKTISFLGMDGLRFDVYMGIDYINCINFLNEKRIKEEI